MSVKTDAMIAHGGADGYTIYVEYDPASEDFNATAVFNDGTVKSITGSMGDDDLYESLLNGSITSIYSEVTELRGFALASCPNLVSVELPECTILERRALYLNPLLSSVIIPKVANIGVSCFESCDVLESVLIPSAVTISATALKSCPNLKYVYIGASATSISANILDGIENVTVDCGFSSSSPAAANAPWGAVNATINYDVAEPNPPVLSGLSLTPNPGLIQDVDLDLDPVDDIQPVEPEPVEVKKTSRKAAK